MRRDYENDSNAPVPNSLVPAASVIVVNAAGQVLLQQRVDNDMWALPGGKMELGESLAECGIRETKEETGIDIDIIGIVGTYTNPKHVFSYDDGEVRQEFSICLLGKPIGGTPSISDESHEVSWFDPDEIDSLPMVASIRRRVDDWRSGEWPVIR
jgi:8-oxo-dGTP pyrophosphatase MutT (NUDIX family)